ncbi:membrane protease YdiL (CAAX protease family) [Actinopolyspora biskrensis]|uniref:Membrane protease YdiL (CAAX protease family) n=1 Tax=Actinopolyspora biskrensis TaxID=1470178 RepID=A0A852Z239_9ACTN|nr:membrane protease YdiL (CAAX protease family) [Actinopolyspora biskrensis]
MSDHFARADQPGAAGEEHPLAAEPPPARGVVRAAPGTPFDMLARNPAHRWWRPLVTLLVFAGTTAVALICTTVLFVGTVLVGMPTRVLRVVSDPALSPEDLLRDPLLMLFFSFALLVALIPAAVLTARWTQRRNPASLVSVVGGFRAGWLGAALLWGLLVFGTMFGVSLLLQVFAGIPLLEGFPGWWSYSSIVLIAVIVVPVQSAAEELVFRGLLLQTLNAWFRVPWLGIVVSSLVFLSGHGYTDPAVWAELLLMAGAMCWLSIRTGGLEAAIALHVSNNSLSLFIAGLSGVPGVEQGGNYPLAQVAPLMVAVVVYTWLVDRSAARRGLYTVVGGREPIHPVTLRPRGSSRAESRAAEGVNS